MSLIYQQYLELLSYTITETEARNDNLREFLTENQSTRREVKIDKRTFDYKWVLDGVPCRHYLAVLSPAFKLTDFASIPINPRWKKPASNDTKDSPLTRPSTSTIPSLLAPSDVHESVAVSRVDEDHIPRQNSNQHETGDNEPDVRSIVSYYASPNVAVSSNAKERSVASRATNVIPRQDAKDNTVINDEHNTNELLEGDNKDSSNTLSTNMRVTRKILNPQTVSTKGRMPYKRRKSVLEKSQPRKSKAQDSLPKPKPKRLKRTRKIMNHWFKLN